jgi:hypothetical protein
MRVSITMPPQEPMRSIYPVGALGWSFAAQGTMNLTALGQGMSFYVKSTTAVSLMVRIVDKWTDPKYGYCSLTHDPLISDWCYNYPEAKCNIVAPAAGQDNWTLCRFVWADFKRDPYSPAKAKALDPTNAAATNIAPSFTAAGAPVARYDITVDDVQFVP